MLRRLTDVRPAERRVTAAAFFTLFGILAGHALLETARDALFLAELPSERLPAVYLLVAGLAFLVFALEERRGGNRSGRGRLASWLIVSALVSLAFHLALGHAGNWLLYLLYAWSGVFSTLVIVRFWTLAGDLFTVGQAKRLFALIGTGSVLGAIAGTGGARWIAEFFPAGTLLLAASGIHLVTACGPVLLFPGHDGTSTAPRTGTGTGTGTGKNGLRDLLQPMRATWDRPYLRRVAAILFVATISFTFVDFLFKSTAARNIAAEDLGAFFATAYFAFNVLSLLVQLFLVGWLVRRLGVNQVHSILPVFFLTGAVAFLLSGGLLAAVGLRTGDGMLRHTLHRTASEFLFVPLTAQLRSRVKGFIDVFGQRGGQALASLILLGLVTFMGNPALLAGALVVLAVIWIALAQSLRKEYLQLFRETVSEVSMRGRMAFPEMDLASLESLMAALNSPRDSEVLASLDILAEQERVRLIPALILYHPSPPVVIRSLELFTQSGREDFLTVTDRLLEHPHPEVRSATLRTRAWMAPSPDLYREFASDLSPIVRATALVGLASYGREDAETARATIDDLIREGTTLEKLALARAIRYSPGAGHEASLTALADTPDLEVRRAAAEAMKEILSPRFIPRLLAMLPEPSLRPQAQTTLVAIGSEALEQLGETLANPWLDRQIRKQLPRTIGRFDPSAAAAILVGRLLEEPDGAVRYRILRTLGRLRRKEPDLPLNPRVLDEAVRLTVRSLFELVDWRQIALRASARDPKVRTPVQQLVCELLQHKEALALERLFRLLGLLHPRDDLRTIYRGLATADKHVRAGSVELLENLLTPPLRDPLIALLDDLDPAVLVERAGSYYVPFRGNYASLLQKLLERGGTGMRSLVAYHVGEIGMHDLRQVLDTLPSDTSGLVARSVDRALAMLDDRAPEGTLT